MKKEEFNFKMMMRQDNFEVLTKCAPKASHRLIEIIAEGYNADFPDDAALEEWFENIEKREKRRFPTRTAMQVMSNLNHVKMLLKSHYKYRFDLFKNYYNNKKQNYHGN